MAQEINEQEILEALVCNEIPDTRAMQACRLKAAGALSFTEKYMQKNHPAAWEKANIIAKIPKRHQRQVFKLSIPLAYPSGDYPKRGFDPDEKTPKTDYYRWKSHCMGDGAMHVTTENNLNRILGIFVRNKLPVKLETAYGMLLDNQRERDAAITVPFSWKVDTYDPCELLLYHQYVAFNKKIVGIPYWWKSEWTVKEEKKGDSYNSSRAHFSSTTTTRVNYNCNAAFFSPDHYGYSANPKKLLQDSLDRTDRDKKEGWDEERQGELISSKSKLLKVGEPVLIYDPEWVEPGAKYP